MPRPLPPDITLDALRREAAALAHPAGAARERVAHPYGFLTWRQLKVHIDRLIPGGDADFLHLACLNYRHDRQILRRRAHDMLRRDPSLGVRDIWSAACVGATDKDDHTPLDWARWRDQAEVVDFLLGQMPQKRGHPGPE